MRLVILVTVLSTLASGGCAGATSDASDGGRDGGSRNHITSEELRDANLENETAWETIQRLRANWLRSRGTSGSGDRTYPVVFVDGIVYGQIRSLRTLNVSDIQEFRYLDARDATTRFGTGYPGGAILVTTNR